MHRSCFLARIIYPSKAGWPDWRALQNRIVAGTEYLAHADVRLAPSCQAVPSPVQPSSQPCGSQLHGVLMLCPSARSSKPTWSLKGRSSVSARILQSIRAGFRSPSGGSHAITKQFKALHRLPGGGRHPTPLRRHETLERSTGCGLRVL